MKLIYVLRFPDIISRYVVFPPLTLCAKSKSLNSAFLTSIFLLRQQEKTPSFLATSLQLLKVEGAPRFDKINDLINCMWRDEAYSFHKFKLK